FFGVGEMMVGALELAVADHADDVLELELHHRVIARHPLGQRAGCEMRKKCGHGGLSPQPLRAQGASAESTRARTSAPRARGRRRKARAAPQNMRPPPAAA